jgi:2-C-methyl-D-erythritol 2,4-cyclodiphosphate synthase
VAVGFGFDIHPLKKGRKLILGGVNIPYKLGLCGHSDADVVLHSLCDAILGAGGLGDMGDFFPDTDPKFKNISSSYFVKKVLSMIKKGEIVNVDITIFAREPKLGSIKQRIKKNIALLLKISPSKINVKAKTLQGLLLNQKRAIASSCVVELKS